MDKITAIKGMNDILPDNSYRWIWLENVFYKCLTDYGYENIRTPIVENTRLFTRSIGEVTDIVEKEMYTFIDSLNGDSLTLRPEGTAGVLRSVIEHDLLYHSTRKLWCMGPMFRHERPQRGRYRQFHQLSVEAMGFNGPDIDAEIILMMSDLWQRLDINNLELQINCLGNKNERFVYRENLIKYFEQHINILDAEAKNRLYKNPLRILDTKNPYMQDLVNNAPQLIQFLGEDSLVHYNGWKNNLSLLGIKFIENSRLVRGLDYYNLSVFEWISPDLNGSSIAGGGRYDPLVQELGGKDNYAIGFGLGIERLLLVLEALGKLPTKPHADVFIATMGEGAIMYAFKVAVQLRQIGYKVIQNFGVNSLKSQLKKADSLNVYISIIIGENEVLNNQVMVKLMSTQNQEIVDLVALPGKMSEYIKI